MPEKINFTIANLNSLQAPIITNRAYYYDTQVNGLCVSITKTGTKSFLVYRKLKGKPIRVTLGRFPDMKIEQARRQAKKTISDLAQGINPIAEKRAALVAGITLSEVFGDYMQMREQKLSANTISSYNTMMRKYFADWASMPLSTITRDKVQARHKKISDSSTTVANKAMRLLRALFNFANGKYENADGATLFPDNPVSRLTHLRAWNKETRRNNRIKDSEFHDWLEAAQKLSASNDAFERTAGDYFQFILFNGLRRREAAGLLIADVDLIEKTFTVRKTKNGLDLTLPLSDRSLEILQTRISHSEGDYVFPGPDPAKPINDPRRALNKMREQSGIQFNLHDLRRTFITVAESLDISMYAVKRLVNHSSSGDVTAGYVVWDPERLRAPMQRITDHILNLANTKTNREPLC
ncbi:MAG: tyrosine-type recombinase/integrase [Pseudomonadales bacterium]|nr:tyrosine-type recombinase/integrase [Pseudomonadales bacterium]